MLIIYYLYLQVIYVKPGNEADLDSLIQDTIRLAVSVNVMQCTTNFNCHNQIGQLFFYMNIELS